MQQNLQNLYCLDEPIFVVFCFELCKLHSNIYAAKLMQFLPCYRLGEEEKGRRVVTTRLLSKANGQLQMIRKITFQLHSVLPFIQYQTGCKSSKRNIVYYAEVISVLMCVCVVSQFDLSITKQNYHFLRCQSLSHIPHTSVRCSNHPLWKLNLMTGVNTTKQQTGEIKNTKRVIWLS